MMDGGVADVASLPDGVLADGGYSLSQVDVDHVMQFLWFVSVVELAQLAVLVLVSGMFFGYMVTRKWGD